MLSLALEVNNFVENQLQSGNSQKKVKSTTGELKASDFKKSIQEARASYKKGNYTVVNRETTQAFLNKLSDKLLYN